jgi:hypothetical protein
MAALFGFAIAIVPAGFLRIPPFMSLLLFPQHPVLTVAAVGAGRLASYMAARLRAFLQYI